MKFPQVLSLGNYVVSGQLAQSLNILQLSEIAVKRPNGQMPGLSGNRQREAVRKIYGPPRVIHTQRCGDYFGVLHGQSLMIEQHVNSVCDLFTRKIKDGIEYPKGLRQHQMRYPSALANELFGCLDFLRIIPCNESNKDFGINREHVGGEYTFGPLASRQWPP